jgi:hypothetical protein
MKINVRSWQGLNVKCILTIVVVSVMAVFSAKAQFSVTLTSVQDLDGVDGINYQYSFTVSGNLPDNPDYDAYGIDFYMDGFNNVVTGGLSLSNVGDCRPSDPPETSGNFVMFDNYYNGGSILGTLTVDSSGSLDENLDWSISEIGDVNNNPYSQTDVFSDSGVVAAPEPTTTGLFLGGLIMMMVAAPGLRRFRTGLKPARI